jgi:hypothetical protein
MGWEVGRRIHRQKEKKKKKRDIPKEGKNEPMDIGSTHEEQPKG